MEHNEILNELYMISRDNLNGVFSDDMNNTEQNLCEILAKLDMGEFRPAPIEDIDGKVIDSWDLWCYNDNYKIV